MNPNTLRWSGIASIVVAAGAGIYLLNVEPETPEEAVRPREVAPLLEAKPSASPSGRPPDSRPRRIPKIGEAKPVARPAAVTGRAWLEGQGRDASSLLAMWDLTGDVALLTEAAEKFPTDPGVCLAMIRHLGSDPAKALEWTDRFIAADPENPSGHFLKAWALEGSGDRAGGLAMLRTATAMTEKAPPENNLRDRVTRLREAAAACGLSQREIAYYVLQQCREESHSGRVFGAVFQTVMRELESAVSSGDATRLAEAGALGLTASRGLLALSHQTLADESAAARLQRAILSRLPDGSQVGPDGQTAAEMRDALPRESALVAKGRTAIQNLEAGLLASVPDATAAEYNDRFVREGEARALQWLQDQVPGPSQGGGQDPPAGAR